MALVDLSLLKCTSLISFFQQTPVFLFLLLASWFRHRLVPVCPRLSFPCQVPITSVFWLYILHWSKHLFSIVPRTQFKPYLVLESFSVTCDLTLLSSAKLRYSHTGKPHGGWSDLVGHWGRRQKAMTLRTTQVITCMEDAWPKSVVQWDWFVFVL